MCEETVNKPEDLEELKKDIDRHIQSSGYDLDDSYIVDITPNF